MTNNFKLICRVQNKISSFRLYILCFTQKILNTNLNWLRDYFTDIASETTSQATDPTKVWCVYKARTSFKTLSPRLRYYRWPSSALPPPPLPSGHYHQQLSTASALSGALHKALETTQALRVPSNVAYFIHRLQWNSF